MSKDLYNNLGLNVKSQKYRFVDTDVNLDEDGFLEVKANKTNEDNHNNKYNQIDTLTENINLNDKKEAEIKLHMKNLNKTKIKHLKQMQNDITEKDSRKKEHDKAYNQLKTDISTYNERVNQINSADIITFNTNKLKNTSTLNAIKNSLVVSELTPMEEMIKKTLEKNKYNSEENIIQKETQELSNLVNPEILQQRYEDMRRTRALLFQQEIKNMHRNKIKSKLYHKIKKKQKEKMEETLLKQLQEVDPEAVKEYMMKKMEKRIDERISLKHTLNKFNKTVKRYHLLNDETIKESAMENFRKRDKLMERVYNPNKDESDEDDENSDYNEEDENENEEDEYDNNLDEEEEDKDEEQIEYSENDNVIEEEAINKEFNKKFDKGKLLLDFNEKKPISKNTDDKSKSGILGMNFMKNAGAINEKLKNLSKQDNYDNKSENSKISKNSSENANKKIRKIEFKLGNSKKRLDDKDCNESKRVTKDNSNSNNIEVEKNIIPNVLTSKVLKEMSQYGLTKSSTNLNLNLNEELIDEINKNDDLNYILKNDINKIDFIKDQVKEALDTNKQEFLKGWGSWTGESKVIKTKEFLMQKRMKEIQERKAALQLRNLKNPTLKVSAIIDKKFENYLVNEIPYNVNSKEQFERLNSTSIGPDCNGLTQYKKLIQPNVVKLIGKVINPMGKKLDDVKTQKLNDIIDTAGKKIHRSKAKL